MKSILIFGDSNTWGLVPGTNPFVRYSDEIRWSGLLQKELIDTRIIEEGLCGRTTSFEDKIRPGRNASQTFPVILESKFPFEKAVIMLGTNDCKSIYRATAREISAGMENCLFALEKYIRSEDILLISPILLGNKIAEKDADFDETSIATCAELKKSYQTLAASHGTRFLAASDVAKADEKDDEHLNADGHYALFLATLDILKDM